MEFFKSLTINQKRVLVIVISLISSLIFYAILPESYKQNESTDYEFYYKPVGENIANGRGLLENTIHSTYRYTIGFPLLLSGVFKFAYIFHVDQNTAVTLFSILCFSMSALIIFELYSIYLGENLAILSAFIFISYPIILWTIKQPNSETPFIPFLYLSILLLFKLKKESSLYLYIALGISLGITMLVRPIALFLPLIFSIVIFFNPKIEEIKTKFKMIFITLFSVCLTILPWEYYMYSQQNKFILLSTGGSPSIIDGLTFNANLKNYRQKLNMSEDVQQVMINLNNNLNYENTTREVKEMLLVELKRDPVATIKLYVLKLFRCLYATDSHRNEKPIVLIQIFYLLFCSLSLYILAKSQIITKYEILPILVIFIYFWLMSSVVLSILRYTTPMFGIMVPVIAGLFQKDLKKYFIVKK